MPKASESEYLYLMPHKTYNDAITQFMTVHLSLESSC